YEVDTSSIKSGVEMPELEPEPSDPPGTPELPTSVASERDDSAAAAPRAGRLLVAWAGLIAALQAVVWVTGVRPLALSQAVDLGVARAESRSIGEVSDSVIRKAIHTQRATLTFWTALALTADFAIEPLAPAVRATAVATLLSALAALVGRPI